MFGKKKEELRAVPLTILTTEYIIDGTVDGDTNLFFDAAKAYLLTSARVRFTRPGGIPDRTCPSYRVMGSQAVLMVPETD